MAQCARPCRNAHNSLVSALSSAHINQDNARTAGGCSSPSSCLSYRQPTRPRALLTRDERANTPLLSCARRWFRRARKSDKRCLPTVYTGCLCYRARTLLANTSHTYRCVFAFAFFTHTHTAVCVCVFAAAVAVASESERCEKNGNPHLRARTLVRAST